MKTIQIEIPEGKTAMWVKGVLTLVNCATEKKEFKKGDKAILTKDTLFISPVDTITLGKGKIVEVTDTKFYDGIKYAYLKWGNYKVISNFNDIKLFKPKLLTNEDNND